MGLVAVHKQERKAQRMSPSDLKAAREAWKIADAHLEKFTRAFRLATEALIDGEMEKQFVRALRMRNVTIEQRLNAMPFFDPDRSATFPVWQRFASRIEVALRAVAKDARRAEMERRGWSLRAPTQKIKAPKPKSTQGAEAYIRKRSLSMATGLSKSEKDRIRDVLQEGFKEGWSTEEMTQRIKRSVGLSKKQAKNIRKMEKRLIEEEGFTKREAATIAKRSTRNLVEHRARTIARTETVAAESQSLLETWRQAEEEGLMPPGTKKKWVAIVDQRTTRICQNLNQKTTTMGKEFWSPVAREHFEGPPAHAFCRSTLVLEFPEDQ